MSHLAPRRSRTGNALVLAVGMMALVAAVIITTTDSAVQSVKESAKDLEHQKLASAVNATLVRRERLLTEAASLGAEGFVRRFDANYTYDFSTAGFVGQENYGVDFIDQVQVRWAIEPVKARDAGIWRQNPRPDGDLFDIELPNTFLFKIRAEGRLTESGPTPSDQRARARVEGVRWTAVNKEPLFRYIIFYAAEGPKGDIEFNHSATFAARGSVHTNGAIYLGSGAQVNRWSSLLSNAGREPTLLGPDINNAPVLVNGYDGIYRLSKHTLYGIANGAMDPSQPSNFVPTGWYDIDPVATYPGEYGTVVHYRKPASAGSIYGATYNGTEINPQRVKDGNGLETTRGFDSIDDKRKINNIPMYGVNSGSLKANDARDRFRPATELKWATNSLQPSPNGFDKKGRTSENGGRIVRLPAVMANRPLEVQRIRYDDLDGDPATDQHEYARPLFLVSGAETATYPTTGPVIESPGNYVGYALGDSRNAFVRINYPFNSVLPDNDVSSGYNAWTVRNKDGVTAVTQPAKMGLIIRERMMPDRNYLSATTASPSGPDYVPYAYGKHFRTHRMPMWPLDVSAYTGGDTEAGVWGKNYKDANNANYYDTANGADNKILQGYFEHVYQDTVELRMQNPFTGASKAPALINVAKQQQTYSDGGSLNIQAAVGESLTTWNQTRSAYQRAPRFYRSSWRMFHLQRPLPNEAKQGLTAMYFNDNDPRRSEMIIPGQASSGWLGPMGGLPVLTRLDTDGIDESDATTATILAGTSVPGDNTTRNQFSIRWTGFIKPRFTESYQFILSSDDGGRLWVNDVRMADMWSTHGYKPNTGGTKTSMLLEQDVWYPIVVEYFQSEGSNVCKLEWKSLNQSQEVIPASRCAPMAGESGAAFPKSTWKSVIAKITPRVSQDNEKLGLMVRPAATRSYVPGSAIGNQSVILEAEKFDSAAGNVPAAWVKNANDPGYTGNGYVTSSANTDPVPPVWSGSLAKMTYNVTLPQAGTWYVWLRTSAEKAIDDSVYPSFTENGGVESRLKFGAAPGTASSFGMGRTPSGNLRSSSQFNNWLWTNQLFDSPTPSASPRPAYITVANANQTHQFYLYMREDGIKIDKIVFTNVPPNPDGSGSFPIMSGNVLTVNSAGEVAAGLPANGASDGTTPTGSSRPDQGPGGLPYLLQGQDPYVMLGYSATRGIFAEFRRDRATSDFRKPQLSFIGEGTDTQGNLVTSSGEVGEDGANSKRVAKLIPSQTENTLYPPAPQSGTPRTNDPNTGKPAKVDPPGTPGDGTADLTNIPKGPWTFSTTDQPRTFISQEHKISWTFTLDQSSLITPNNSKIFQSTDNQKGIRLFQSGTGTDILANLPIPGLDFVFASDYKSFTITAKSENVNGWIPWGDASLLPNSLPNFTYDSGTGPRFNNLPVTKTVVSADVVQASVTLGDANTYWYDLSDPPKNTTGGMISWSEFSNKITAIGGTPRAVNPGDVAIPIPSFLKPGQLTVTPPAPPADPWPYGTTPRTFSVDRSSTIDIDLNSYVSAWGDWFATAAPQVLPWSSVWSSMRHPPDTGSFRPDAWGYKHGGTYDKIFPPRRTGVTAFNAPGADPIDLSENTTAAPRWPSDQPSSWNPANAPTDVWLRINRSTSDVVTLQYALTEGNWVNVKDRNGSPVAWSVGTWSPDLLIGPCVQSGSRIAASTADFADLTVEFYQDQLAPEIAAKSAPAYRLNALDWDASDGSGVTDQQRYLAGQYQIFFGPYDITEDFFTWTDPDSGRAISDEIWFYNQRQFWSQSRWWNDGSEKDLINLPDGTTMTVRELLARQTVFSIDTAMIQKYLKARTLTQAVRDAIANAGSPAPLPVPDNGAVNLAAAFNGVFYAARTNRYPWNPNLNGPNPWNPALPNVGTADVGNDALLAMDPSTRATTFAGSTVLGKSISDNQSKLHSGANATRMALDLQPYPLVNDQAPALKPTQFSHAVRFFNGSSIDWGFTVGTPDFGTGKTAIVTPNPIYIQGNFNNTKQTVKRSGAVSMEWIPLAIMGDQVNILSAQWNDNLNKQPGIKVDNSGLVASGGSADGSLTRGGGFTFIPAASSTEVVGAIVTHNQPTTRESVINGESASIISTVLFQENWLGKTFDYTGSLVVMDSRRYSDAYLLDSVKDAGPSVFGYMGNTWRTTFGKTDALKMWDGSAPQQYYVPQRNFTFNSDFLTPQGTPPFAPFGTAARGIGGWIRVTQ